VVLEARQIPHRPLDHLVDFPHSRTTTWTAQDPMPPFAANPRDHLLCSFVDLLFIKGLRLHEICNLRLNADLVVFSGCQTALGKDVSSEGIIGVTRCFSATKLDGLRARENDGSLNSTILGEVFLARLDRQVSWTSDVFPKTRIIYQLGSSLRPCFESAWLLHPKELPTQYAIFRSAV
jgi:hypothetical protein